MNTWTELTAVAAGERGLTQAAGVVKAHSDSYTSVFLYALEGSTTLVLRAFAGRPTDQIRIPVGDGVCGRAVSSGEDQLVSDVSADPDYISCSLETRSECVVLVWAHGRIVGEIDIDSDVPGAFTGRDIQELHEAAHLIAPLF